ncbi:MAG: antibiotic biosynthesis monooxygenase [Spirochaetes bacterium DG_61]|nr:MAG: antibiotic biosynthesis monooxygenase [Spirochaetes bacterium DG_61]
MFVSCVTVYVKEEHIQDFIDASIKNHEGSLKEPGNMRFDVLQCVEDPARFLLYEAYESEDVAKAHKSTPHYLKWKSTVDPYMLKPREGVGHRVIAPQNRAKW